MALAPSSTGAVRRAAPAGLVAGAAVVVFLAPAALLGGCAAETVALGRSGDVRGDYQLGELTVQLDQRASVLDAAAAAEGALVRRGYTITQRFAGEGQARLTATTATPGRMWDATVWITNRLAGPEIAVRVALSGDVAESRSILNDTLAQLGR